MYTYIYIYAYIYNRARLSHWFAEGPPAIAPPRMYIDATNDNINSDDMSSPSTPHIPISNDDKATISYFHNLRPVMNTLRALRYELSEDITSLFTIIDHSVHEKENNRIKQAIVYHGPKHYQNDVQTIIGASILIGFLFDDVYVSSVYV